MRCGGPRAPPSSPWNGEVRREQLRAPSVGQRTLEDGIHSNQTGHVNRSSVVPSVPVPIPPPPPPGHAARRCTSRTSLVGLECAGDHPEAWDHALLRANVPAAARLRIEEDFGSDPPPRRHAFWACVAFALVRELKFARGARLAAELRDTLRAAVMMLRESMPTTGDRDDLVVDNRKDLGVPWTRRVFIIPAH